MGVDYVVIGFDIEVLPLVTRVSARVPACKASTLSTRPGSPFSLITHNAAWPFCVSAVCIDVVSNHLLFAHMP